jgi:hypothetical protein
MLMHKGSDRWEAKPYLSELSDVADTLAVQRLEISGDAGILEVDDTSERFVKEGADGGDGEATGLGGESMDHGLEAHVNLARSNDLRDIFVS